MAATRPGLEVPWETGSYCDRVQYESTLLTSIITLYCGLGIEIFLLSLGESKELSFGQVVVVQSFNPCTREASRWIPESEARLTGIQSEFQDVQGYREKPCLENQN